MPIRWQVIIWANDGLAYWCYASPRLNVLTYWGQDKIITLYQQHFVKRRLLWLDQKISTGPDHGLVLNSLWPSYALWHHWTWVNIGPGYSLLPEGTKPLPEPMLTIHKWGLVKFTWVQFWQGLIEESIPKMSLKITILRLQLYIPGANKLTDTKPSPEPMLTQFTDASMHHQDPIC